MLPLLAIGLALGSIPGEGDEEPVGFLLTADVGAVPRAVLEVERPLGPWGSAFLSLGSPSLLAVPAGRLPGPQIAAGGRVYPFGHGPWGVFLDGRLLANLYTANVPQFPSLIAVPGAAVTVGLSAKLWHAVVSSGVSLYYVPDLTTGTTVFPALRLAVSGWN